MNTSNNTGPHGVSLGTIIACIVLSVGGFLVYTGHGAHMLGFFPYLLILACPLMHLFMHGGHGHHHENHQTSGVKGSDCCGGHGESKDDKPVSTPKDSDSKENQS